MTRAGRRGERRTDRLSKERIVEAATELLDTEGEAALTFRALSRRLATGAGAIYHHIGNKDELLAAAADAVVDRVLSDVDGDIEPHERIRATALGMFDAIDEHAWVGAHLAREPGQSTTLRVFERIGGSLYAMDVPERALFDAASALLNYILGTASQNAANARRAAGRLDRSTFLAELAGQWSRLDPEEYPFATRITEQLSDHDDREQFLAGIDLILAGVDALPRRDG